MISIIQAIGIRMPKYISLYTKYVFSNTNIAVTKYTIAILSFSVKVKSDYPLFGPETGILRLSINAMVSMLKSSVPATK